MIIEAGTERFFRAGDKVRLEYELQFTRWDPCYSSERDGDLSITIGKSISLPGLMKLLGLLKIGS